MKYKKQFLFLLMLAIIIALPVMASALSLNIQNYPEIGGVDLDCIAVNTCDLSVGIIVAFIYNASIWIGGVVAFITIVYAGFLYIFSGSAPGNRSKAKGMLTNVVWGIGILLLSYIALVLINPDLINSPDLFLREVMEKDADLNIGDVDNKTEEEVGYGANIEDCLRNEGYSMVKLQQCTNNCIVGSGDTPACMLIAAEATIKLCIEENGKNDEGRCLSTQCIQWLNLPDVDPVGACSTAWADAIGAGGPGPGDDPVPDDFIAILENACVTSADELPAGCTVENTSSNSVTCKATFASSADIGCYENFRNTCNSYGTGNKTSLTNVLCGNGINDCVLSTCIYTGS